MKITAFGQYADLKIQRHGEMITREYRLYKFLLTLPQSPKKRTLRMMQPALL